MPRDVQTVLQVSRIFLAITAICVTLFPLLYGLLSPWYKSHLGRAVLLQSVAIALAIDISAYGQFWAITEDIRTILIINVVFLSFISLTSLYLLGALIYYNLIKNTKENENV